MRRSKEELSPARTENKEATYFVLLRSRRSLQTIHTYKAFSWVKKKVDRTTP